MINDSFGEPEFQDDDQNSQSLFNGSFAQDMEDDGVEPIKDQRSEDEDEDFAKDNLLIGAINKALYNFTYQ